MNYEFFQALLGLTVIIALCFLFSENRMKISWKHIVRVLVVQFFLALFLIKTSIGKDIFIAVGEIFQKLVEAYQGAISIVIGDSLLFKYSIALGILPMIIFVTAISAVLYHYRIAQFFIYTSSMFLKKLTGMTGPEACAASANIFLGMAEAPTLIAPYISKLTRAQLFMVMVSGMATLSGSFLLVCAGVLESQFAGGIAEASAHLLMASVISAPAAFIIARLLVPEMHSVEGDSVIRLEEVKTNGFFDALSQGTFVGIKLTAYVIGMLIVIIATVNFLNIMLVHFFGSNAKMELILGQLFKYPAWLLGIPLKECEQAGQLLGTKIVLNELVAYQQMAQMEFTARTSIILSYAMCGFANLGSIGIMIASMAGLCPERRSEIAGLGFKAMCAGFLAICMTAIMVALIL
jgi:CNT family concentrative nucleoside transporter